MSSVEPERLLLHYRIIDKVGEGGMGQVYRAEDTKLGRNVALKLLTPDATRDQSAKRRLLAEAQSASVLNHPNIVTIHAIEEVEGFDFIVMEFVEGETLTAHLANNGALPLPSLLDIGIQIAEALETAHSVGLIHRDIKPANILITPKGVAKVTDFGLAKMVRLSSEEIDREALTLAANLTGPGIVLGTAAYMSPEQTRGETLDARSEIFSLGSLLYECATRTRAFSGPSVLAIMHAIAAIDPPAPSKLRPELPREFDLIIERALAKEKTLRYPSAREMADALRSLRSSITGTWSGIPIVYDPDLIDRSAPSFVGRESEIQKLEGLLQQTIEGTGRIVFITGEPGIGKTSLSDEFLRRARKQQFGIMISRGRCIEQYGTGEAFLPVLDALEKLCLIQESQRMIDILRRFAPSWLIDLPALISPRERESLARQRTGTAPERRLREIAGFLEETTKNRMVVLVLEDLQWADPSTLALISFLARRREAARFMLIGTCRGGVQSPVQNGFESDGSGAGQAGSRTGRHAG